jgi:hypothetical protein
MKKLLASLALTALVTVSQAQFMHQLVAQWVENGNRFCKYSNGTVLNVGINLCQLSIT